MKILRTSFALVLTFIVIISGNLFSREHPKQIKHAYLNASLKYYGANHSDYNKAIKELVSYGEESARFLVSELGTKDPRKSEVIKASLIRIGQAAVEPLLREIARSEENAALATYLLGEIGDNRALVPLLIQLRSYNPELRAAAARALGALNDSLAIPQLLHALSDSVTSVKRYAALSLGKLRAVNAIDELIQTMKDQHYSVRYSASYALVDIGGEYLCNKLIELLNRSEGNFKFHLIETLGALKHPEVLPTLLDLLEDPSYETRGFSCEALGNFRGQFEVANALKKALHDESDFVKMKAGNALANILN
ncbi:HEAT repeat domain-containing protein [bacterium]|nr:HEAT repeat domain-containing protein [bacterium]